MGPDGDFGMTELAAAGVRPCSREMIVASTSPTPSSNLKFISRLLNGPNSFAAICNQFDSRGLTDRSYIHDSRFNI
jgi:hypothetical protein